MPRHRPKRALIIAGPNGAGKTTFALQFLPREAGVYKSLVDEWWHYDNSGRAGRIIDHGGKT